MKLSKLYLDRYTVFDLLHISLAEGINIFIGENGTGKSHLLKVLYAASRATDGKTAFAQKLVNLMLPDDYQLARLLHKGAKNSYIRVEEESGLYVSLYFDDETYKWNAAAENEAAWENGLINSDSIFIPAKEILSNCYQLNSAVARRNVKFDDTYIDIIDAAKVDVGNTVETNMICEDIEQYGWQDRLLKKIEALIDGKVFYDPQKDGFYLRNANSKLEFNLVAEGIRKLALLWQLLKNSALERGSILFWDEPEANINPAYLRNIVEILLALERHGVQIFLSTHNYMLAKYFEVLKNDSDTVLYHSLYKTEQGIGYECGEAFDDLKNNAIINSFDKLLDEIYDMGVSKHE